MKQLLTKTTIEKLNPKQTAYLVWDERLTGFGLKVTPAHNRIYVVQYRLGGRESTTKRYTIGKHGQPWTVDQARKEAKRILGQVAQGQDPQSEKINERKSITVEQLCEQYLKEGVGTKKPSTLSTDRGRIERHIKPLLGKKKVKDLNSNDVRRFMEKIAQGKTSVDEKTGKHGRARVTGGKGTASRTVGLLGGIFSFAIAEGIRADNPVRGVKRYPDTKKERFLTPEELARLGQVLQEQEENAGIHAIAAIRLLLFTGCRKDEVLSLKWDYVDFDFGCLRLPDSKTGQKTVAIGAPALRVLNEIPRVHGNPFVIVGAKEGSHLVGLARIWNRIRKEAGLNDVRLHDLRHSFASAGVVAGMGLPILGKLLGQKDPKTTARYAHLGDDPLKSAADRISTGLEAHLNGSTTNKGNIAKFKAK